MPTGYKSSAAPQRRLKFTFFVQKNSRGAFCRVKSHCMTAFLWAQQPPFPAGVVPLINWSCVQFGRSKRRKQAATVASIMLVTSSPRASFKGSCWGRGASSAWNRLWGTNSSSPPLWSSSFDHRSNPGSAPPFAMFFSPKWMSAVQNFSETPRDTADSRLKTTARFASVGFEKHSYACVWTTSFTCRVTRIVLRLCCKIIPFVLLWFLKY